MQKAIALALCAVLCSCFVSGCVGSSPTQNETGQGSDSLRASEISLSSASTASGVPVSVKAALKDSSGHALDGKVVEWFIDSRSIGRSQMKNGVTTLSLTGAYVANLGPSTHQMQVNFYGDTSYKSATATAFLMINATINATAAPLGTVPSEFTNNASASS